MFLLRGFMADLLTVHAAARLLAETFPHKTIEQWERAIYSGRTKKYRRLKTKIRRRKIVIDRDHLLEWAKGYGNDPGGRPPKEIAD